MVRSFTVCSSLVPSNRSNLLQLSPSPFFLLLHFLGPLWSQSHWRKNWGLFHWFFVYNSVELKKGICALTFQNKENHSTETLSCPVAFIMQRQKNTHFHFDSHLLRRQFNLVCLSSPRVRRSPPFPPPPLLFAVPAFIQKQMYWAASSHSHSHLSCSPLPSSRPSTFQLSVWVFFFFFHFLLTPFNLFSSHFCTTLQAFYQP